MLPGVVSGMLRTRRPQAILRSYELMINCRACFVTSQKDDRMNLSFLQWLQPRQAHGQEHDTDQSDDENNTDSHDAPLLLPSKSSPIREVARRLRWVFLLITLIALKSYAQMRLLLSLLYSINVKNFEKFLVQLYNSYPQIPAIFMPHLGHFPVPAKLFLKTEYPWRSINKVLHCGQYVFSSDPTRPGKFPAYT